MIRAPLRSRVDQHRRWISERQLDGAPWNELYTMALIVSVSYQVVDEECNGMGRG